ncbi:hypothetical protein JB92DRAFT_2834729 [Gautieria morchelliformis]|nr:hypothetical protein JB92DRAFT_2834729 [Gautieria morchelliformis]
MDIAGLLNPPAETYNIFNATDEEIFESVMDVKKLQESNEDDDDNIDMLAPGPTRREALQAALTLKKYLGTFDDSFACNLEGMLGSLGQQTRAVEMRAMKDTKVLDYFPRK